MGELLNEIKSEKTKTGKKSLLAEVIEKLPKDQQKDLLSALDDHSISASKISKVLERRGVTIAPEVISRYRRGELRTDIRENI